MKMPKFSQTSYVHTFLSLCLIAMMSLTACEQTDDVIGEVTDDITAQEIVLVEEEENADIVFEDAMEVTLEAMEITDDSPESRDVTAESTLSLAGPCVTVTHDVPTKTITIDFGTGCTGPDGKTRSGQVIVVYTQRLYVPGASLTTTLNNFAVDGVQVEGTRQTSNVSTSLAGPFSLKVTLQGGKATFPDGTVATRTYTRTSTWIRAANPLNDEFHIDGALKHTTRASDSLQVNIISTLIRKRKCKFVGTRIPVMGLKLIDRNGVKLLIDYGDGTCDNIITVTKNGKSKVIDLDNP